MGKFKSHLFYWYTGNKLVAIISLAVSTAIMWAALVVSAGFSIWGIITALLLDVMGFWLALIYFFLLRNYVPFMLDKVDGFVIQNLIIPAIIGSFLSRIVCFFVAGWFGVRTN
jgi:hypothetical protein